MMEEEKLHQIALEKEAKLMSGVGGKWKTRGGQMSKSRRFSTMFRNSAWLPCLTKRPVWRTKSVRRPKQMPQRQLVGPRGGVGRWLKSRGLAASSCVGSKLHAKIKNAMRRNGLPSGPLQRR